MVVRMHGTTRSFFIFGTVAAMGTAIGWFLFEAMPRTESSAANNVEHSVEAAEFYRTCMAAPEDTSGDHFWVFQRTFCQCYTEVAVEHLEGTDIRIILSRTTGGNEAAAKALSRLSDAQLASYVERQYAFQAAAIPNCMKQGMAAREAARAAM